MNKETALRIFVQELVREILRDDDVPLPFNPGNMPEAYREAAYGVPQPNLDPSEDDFCEHGGMQIPRNECPVHSDEAQEYVPTAEELDDLTSETFEEENPMIARARRLAEQKANQTSERLFPDDLDLPMKGMAPPGDLPPNLVV